MVIPNDGRTRKCLRGMRQCVDSLSFSLFRFLALSFFSPPQDFGRITAAALGRADSLASLG
jgi:hypothetical protein